MEQWCALLIGAVVVVPQIVVWITSRWLDGLPWWDNLPSDRKAEAWALGSALVGVAIGYVVTLLGCPGWVGWPAWLLALANATWAHFFNKALHRRRNGR